MNHKTHSGFLAGLKSGPKKEEEDNLPAHVERMSGGGLACLHCGGEVDDEGNAYDDMDQDEEVEMAREKAVKS